MEKLKIQALFRALLKEEELPIEPINVYPENLKQGEKYIYRGKILIGNGGDFEVGVTYTGHQGEMYYFRLEKPILPGQETVAMSAEGVKQAICSF